MLRRLCAAVLSCTLLSSCATVRFAKRHPVAVGLVGGAAVSLGVVSLTRRICAKTYDGKPYYGTPPCPK